MITSLTATQTGPDTWLLAFASDLPDPTFYVYRDGVLLATTAAAELLVQVREGGSPVFEVLDSAAAPSDGYPATVTLAWYGSASADRYTVQQYVGGVWTDQATVTDDGSGYFRWESGLLADSTTHQFRVVPVSAAGNSGAAVTFLVLMVRFPDVPLASYSYNSGTGAVTISAA